MRMYLFILLLLLKTGLISAQNKAPETKFLVQPYLQFSTQNGMYVLWETKEPATTLVQFGEARAKVDQVVLDREARLEGTRLMHEILLDNLKPETNYFWQVTTITQSGERIQTPVHTFKTAVKDSTAYLFGLVGDTQRNSRTPWAWGKIPQGKQDQYERWSSIHQFRWGRRWPGGIYALMIDQTGDHTAVKKMSQTLLAAGKHKIRIEYFELSGSQFLQAGWWEEKVGAVPFTPFQLGHE